VILTRLVEYADSRMELPPVMYGLAPVRWTLVLEPDGRLSGVVSRGGGKENRRGEEMLVPSVVRAAGIKPKLLADNGEYVLGLGRADSDPKKVADRHRQFVDLTRRCAEATSSDEVRAVVAFLERWDAGEFREEVEGREGFDPQADLTFRVGGVYPVDLPEVRAFWASETSGKDAPELECLVTGAVGPVEKRLPVKVKGLTRIGGQSAGTSLVSANAPAFESYGLENSLTSPISRDAGERFGKALNELLAGEKSRVFIGNVVYVFWTREPSELDIGMFMERPDPERVKRLFESAQTGRHDGARVGANRFYALALSASGGRAVVRDWLETTVPRAEANLRRWFAAQELVDYGGGEGAPLSVFRLAASAYRDAGKEMQPAVSAAMVRVALGGGKLPHDLLARAVRRCVVGTARQDGTREHVTRERAALIKLIFTTQERLDMSEMKSLNLDPEFDNREDREAYACGRLLAELEGIQRAALGRINATITDRYYGAASSTPASVFGMLVGDTQSHLSKLRKTKPGVHGAVQERLEEIMSSLSGYPKTLNMERQGLFALGYYHQRAHNRAAARAAGEAREARENGETPSSDGEES
jgi:CRISPR-associated protein Csd1